MRPNLRGRYTAWTVLICALVLDCLLAITAVAQGQESRTHDGLARTIAGLDTALFNAFNSCDLKALGALVTEDLEFFHDVDGLSVGKQAFLNSVRQNVCGKMRRDL